MKRAEVDWSETPYPETVMGHTTTDGKPEQDDPVAVLWVPDIDARHRWREYAVFKSGKPRRGMGFRKPGER